MLFSTLRTRQAIRTRRHGNAAGASRLVAFILMLFLLAWAGAAGAGDDAWKEDFERLCGYTDIASTLDSPKLLELINECDQLLERLEKLADPKKKVYIFRTKKCRDLFRFVLETKDK